jgi:hypothetical protein
MTNNLSIHLWLAVLPVFAASSRAAADPLAVHDGPPSGATQLATAATEAEPAGSGTAVTAAPASAPAPPAERYPRAVIARPLTLPAGLGVLGADATANHDFTAMAGAPIVGYGLTDDLEVQVPYAFSARDFEIKGTLNADLGYKLLRGAADGKLEAIARIRGGYDLVAETATPLMIGVHVQYNLTDTLAIISGTPGSQQLRIALDDGGTGARPIDLSLPVGLGWQATGQLYFQLDTRLVQLALHDASTVVLGADATPVALTAVYNVLPALDVQAVIATDLSNTPGDAVSFLLGARYYAGAR